MPSGFKSCSRESNASPFAIESFERVMFALQMPIPLICFPFLNFYCYHITCTRQGFFVEYLLTDSWSSRGQKGFIYLPSVLLDTKKVETMLGGRDSTKKRGYTKKVIPEGYSSLFCRTPTLAIFFCLLVWLVLGAKIWAKIKATQFDLYQLSMQLKNSQ